MQLEDSRIVRLMKRSLTTFLLLVGILLATLPARSARSDPLPEDCSWASVLFAVDGDTIDVRSAGRAFRVRYIGVDAAESGQACFGQASAENRSLVEGQVVCLQRDVSDTDLYGRLLRYVFVGETMVNAELLRRGVVSRDIHAPDVRHAQWFAELEHQARTSGRGCWGITLPYPAYMPHIAVRAVQQEPTVEATLPPGGTPTPGGDKVWVTDTGSKYHRWGCTYLRLSAHEVSCAWVATAGYAACSVCRPWCP